jgi:hypothetical protein
MCGRTTANTAAIVIAASIAFPPRRRTAAPAIDASAWSDTTAASRPITSGRIIVCAARWTGVEPSMMANMDVGIRQLR